MQMKSYILSLHLTSFGNMFCISNLYFFKLLSKYSSVWLYSSLFIDYSVGEHLGGFQFGDIVNKAANNIFVQMFSWAY